MNDFNIKTNTLKLIDVTEEKKECENCVITQINCGNNQDYCALADYNKIFVGKCEDECLDNIDIYINEIKNVLKKFIKHNFGNEINEEESFNAKILQKSFHFSEVKLRILKDTFSLDPDIIRKESALKEALFEIVKNMPHGTILTIRTYMESKKKFKNKLERKIDFTIKRIFDIQI